MMRLHLFGALAFELKFRFHHRFNESPDDISLTDFLP